MINKDLSNKEYHEHASYSSSDVKAVATSTIYHWKNAVRKESAAFDLGSAVHAMLLEPEKNLVIEGPETRRGKEWKELKDATDFGGKILLPKKEYHLAENMSQSAMFTENVNELLTDSLLITEASFFVHDRMCELDLKCRPDGLLPHKRIMFDIKTCQDASPTGFAKAVRDYGYDIQAAFYKHVMHLEGVTVKDFFFICIEKTNPFIVQVHKLSDEYLNHAHMRMIHTLKTIREADVTQDYSTGWPEVNTIDLPKWMEN
jgi:hypothetical protein